MSVDVSGVTPWISVMPSMNPAAILGPLPFALGTVTLTIPSTVVPDDADGILVFAWSALSGVNADFAYWHFAVNVGEGAQNWFSLLVAGDPTGASASANSQAFWLPFPADRTLYVTLFVNALTSPSNRGEVEIHGYARSRVTRAVP